MLWSFNFCMFSFILSVSAGYKVDKDMAKAKIIPDLIPIGPKGMLHVSFLNGKKARLGNELLPMDVKEKPWVKWDHAFPSSFYTLCMVGIDASVHNIKKKYKEWNHWLVINIPGHNLGIEHGDTINEYVGTEPPSGLGGLHRYIFLVYKQPSKLVLDESNPKDGSSTKRDEFSVVKFAKKYHLGIPVAGNFYKAYEMVV